MIRAKITDPWREVSWDEAIGHVASEFKRIQAEYGRGAIGGITSSRCTNEETFLVQKLVRAGFGNNNVDTCARVCHSPTGYGLSKTFGTSAGTQDFDSVDDADVIVVIGANPTDAHPVFASRMKKRLRQGAKLIVVDPRRIDLVRIAACRGRLSSSAQAGHQRRDVQRAGTCRRDRGPGRPKTSCAERCDADAFADWVEFVADGRRTVPKEAAQFTGVPAAEHPRRRTALRHAAATPRSITGSA